MRTSDNPYNDAIFPKGDSAPSEYFTGNAWVKMLVPNDEVLNTAVGNVVFEAGARNNWHTHPGGQILIVTHGTGYYQELGKPIQLLQVGDVVNIQPEIKHWHGASPESEFTHIAISTNTAKGIVDWLEPVTDEEYNSYQ
ncbi:cupin [Flavobacterium sp. Root935]|uniref:(R)-mandelonitrile lyase n=1 Tax=Flavobacterium sp. Root935 TaxID=1736610 RepID=UPI00070CA2D8|nr:cupin domain-containing protein [Flavobacterium sp. Root935]KRD58037.1 cupin [Flavobacterium sp. Root935]